MIRKRRRILRKPHETRITEDKEVDISWSSSSEEQVSISPSPKKSKVKDNTHNSNKWFYCNNSSLSSSKYYNNDNLHNICKIGSNADVSDFVCDVVNLKPSTSNSNDCQEDSPIVGSIKINETSPSLTQSENTNDDGSPVIGNSNILKIINQTKRNIAIKKSVLSEFEVTTPDIEFEESRDLFSTQSSCIIDDNKSPEFKTQLQISQISSQISDANEIKVVDSESGTSISVSTGTTNIAYSNNLSGSSLYHELQPKKKKYKKNGLAFHLQKALQKQRSNTSIWLHEHYINKCATNLIQNDEKIKLRINSTWKEYGCTLIYCKFVETTAVVDNQHYCLVIIGFNSIVSCKIEINVTFYLHMPYCVKKVKFKNHILNCYFNVSRILTCC